MTTETWTLEEQVRLVDGLRRGVADTKAALDESRQQWEVENALFLRINADTSRMLAEAEQTLRDMAVAEFQRTGNKQIGPGVGIREVTRLGYDQSQALAWAIEHRLALALDKKRFEDIAKAEAIDFVSATTEPQATIATDLAKALGLDD